jgi:5'-nucleotidase
VTDADRPAATVRPMRILVTNDDGVEAPGLRALARALVDAGHDVVVVAPDGERSGAGAGISRLHRSGPIGWTQVEWPDLPGVAVHALATLPAAAVYAGAQGGLGPPPDLVASGVNRGLNTGHLVLHSGTVGAALTAAVLGLPAVAVSVGWGDDEHWDTAAVLAARAVGWAAGAAGQVLNLNVPNVPLAEVRGVRGARLAPFAEQWTTEISAGEVRLEYGGHRDEPDDDTDLGVVRAGYASVTLLTGLTGDPADAAAAAIAAAGALPAAR